jgi:Uma2 family endonuclease
VSQPPGGLHGMVAGRIAARLTVHAERLGLGTVLVETGYILRREPDTVRGPDVSYISLARLPSGSIPEEFIDGAPDLAVEILSPSSGWSEVEEKIADYFAGGTRLIWLVEPRERQVTVRYPDRPSRVVAAGEILDGEDVVPGFALALVELFG